MICQVCNKETDKGYKVDPKTGRVKPDIFLCDLCYEKTYTAVNGIAEAHQRYVDGKTRRKKAPY